MEILSRLGIATTTGVAPLVIAVVIVVYILNSVAQYGRLRAFKGPPSAALSRIWLLNTIQSGKMHHIFHEVTKKYGMDCPRPTTVRGYTTKAVPTNDDAAGKFARVGPRTLLVADVEFLRKVNGPKSKYHRSDWYKGSRFTPGEDTLISMTDEAEHKSLRVRMTAGVVADDFMKYNLKKDNARCESAVNRQMGNMLDLINTKYLTTGDKVRPLDWGYLASYFSIDSITDISFSEPIGDLQEDKDKWNFLHNTEDNLRPMSFFTIFPDILGLIPTWLMVKFLAPHPGDNSPFGQVLGYGLAAGAFPVVFARKHSRERFGPAKVEKDDMLGVFVKGGMSQPEAERTSILQLIAGSDTVATALRAAILYIASSPSTVARIRAELAAAGVAPDKPTTDIISYSDARNIRYLVAVVREVLRVHPPAIATMEKQLGDEDDVLPDGRVIPAHTNIALSLTAILRDPETWGPDAELFRPERWLEEVDEVTKSKMDRAHEFIFGSGRFLCLGREIAMMHIVKVVAEIFNRYDIAVLTPEKPWHSLAYGIFIQHDQWVRVTKRDLSREGQQLPIAATANGKAN
ncbi:Pisatin demethylase [Madurella mycetomatis]|uniref:Pisatin demethylase n=1 Tax=Madurella mycetomatis TaxID=100816 RepID=A0A175WHV4_9PEZI|nr:Pisatin demethylase [Madurella mycetomatis]